MKGGSATVRKKMVITQPQGLHVRPASVLVKIANRYTADIEIVKDGQAANAKSMMAILTLAAEQGAEVEIIASGKDAELAADEIEKFLSAPQRDDSGGAP